MAACSSPPAQPAPARPEPAPIRTPQREPAQVVPLDFEETPHPLPPEAPEGLAYVPAGFDASAPFDLVVFLHGWNGCVNVLMREEATACIDGEDTEGWGLGAKLSAPQRVVVIPQLAFRRRSGDAGRLSEDGFVGRLYDALLRQLDVEPPTHLVLVAHSAGFESTLAWLGSDVQPNAVVLMDALYSGTARFVDWVEADPARRLVSFATGGSTGRQQRRMRRLADRAEIGGRVWTRRTRARHADVPAAEGPAILGELFEDLERGERLGATD